MAAGGQEMGEAISWRSTSEGRTTNIPDQVCEKHADITETACIPNSGSNEVGIEFCSLYMADDIPSLEGAAKQINALKRLQGLKLVYLATDAPIKGQ